VQLWQKTETLLLYHGSTLASLSWQLGDHTVGSGLNGAEYQLHYPYALSEIQAMVSSNSSDGGGDGFDSSSTGNSDEEEPVLLSQTYRIWLSAANLPAVKKGMFGGKACDAFAVVSSVASSDTLHPQQPEVAGSTPVHHRRHSHGHSIPKPSNLESFDRNSSTASTRSSVSASNMIWGQTEVVNCSSNPQWTKTISMNYQTGSDTFFYVHIFQHSPSGSRRNGEPLQTYGTALFHVTDLLATKNLTRVKRLRSGGCVFCRLEAVSQSNNVQRTVHLLMQATDLVLPGGKVRPRREPDTILEIAKRESSSGHWMVVYRSAPVVQSFHPVFDPIQIDFEILCGGDLNRHVRIQILMVRPKLKNNRRRKLIGMTETTLRHLLQNGDAGGEHVLSSEDDDDNDAESAGDAFEEDDGNLPEARVQLMLQRDSTKLKEVGRIGVLKATLKSGDGLSLDDWGRGGDDVEGGDEEKCNSVVEIVDLSQLSALPAPQIPPPVTPTRSFSSYVQEGCQLDFCVAIDFTSSNGDPREEGSYHYMGENTLNDYEETISAIGQSLTQYSQSQEYAVYGFGAKFGGVVRHLFQLGPTPTVIGVDGILKAYKSIFASDLVMSGPTVFNQVLQAAASRAKRNHDCMRTTPRYTVLLVITDGTIAPSDFDETRHRLDLYSSMPLSIVFVGVGRSDFRLMYQLCRPSPSAATTAYHRCNTTFVEFRRHQHDPSALGEAALRNIPTQLCEYMATQGI